MVKWIGFQSSRGLVITMISIGILSGVRTTSLGRRTSISSTLQTLAFHLTSSIQARQRRFFKNHVNALQAELEMREMRDRFKMLLSETGYVTPGKKLDEVRVLFMGRESFDSLSEPDRQIIYDQHQKDITEKARINFMVRQSMIFSDGKEGRRCYDEEGELNMGQGLRISACKLGVNYLYLGEDIMNELSKELLLEHAELFYHVKSIVPSGTITQEDIREITQALQEDSRYKNLDRLESERTLLLLQHLGFVHCPKKEHCPAYPNCTDILIEKLFAQKSVNNSRPGSGSWSGKGIDVSDSHPMNGHVNLVILGTNDLAQNLHKVIRDNCEDDELEVDNEIFTLDYRIIDGDVSLPQNAFKTSEFVPHGLVKTVNDVFIIS
ncbi:Rho GTPase-activating protein [Armadillidium vulgare]|nr:Rho GTPase-activating protein [Armadillidium vulgare]